MPDLSDAELDQLIKDIGLKRPRGGSQRKPISHGTFKGAQQHRYRNEPMCEPCHEAWLAYWRAQNAKRATRRREARGA
ncbi:hypothetical protein [Streptomyces sp. Amel2xC10]|uniref:hypothetical protein n=1 Tax=Streptomyces sp. Amel2xC10 TaxID=1305826 RepID=UPI000A08E166|nr:hypothetical protein [Streptomyces sp. Amel2xC10]SMF86416.1 hypothetical protein SAMN02745830_07167 [Streptomyces sp. Amel2xC10]